LKSDEAERCDFQMTLAAGFRVPMDFVVADASVACIDSRLRACNPQSRLRVRSRVLLACWAQGCINLSASRGEKPA
jgi:hypothetical protein